MGDGVVVAAGGTEVGVGVAVRVGGSSVAVGGTGVGGAAVGSGVDVAGAGVAVGSVVAQAATSDTQIKRQDRSLLIATPFFNRSPLATQCWQAQP